MKLKTHQTDLNKALQKAQGATGGSLEITECILMTNNTLRATDLEIGIETTFDADIEQSGAVVLPPQIINIVKELPKETVIIEVDDNYKAKITAGNSEFTLNCYNPDEFPQLPKVVETKETTINSYKLEKALKQAIIATSSNETTPALCGILFEKDYITATNTYCLSNVKINIGIDKAIIPGRAVNEIIKRCRDVTDVTIRTENNYIEFVFGDTTLISRIIEGNFPNWRVVIPKDYQTQVRTDRQKLLSAVKRASLIARQESNVIKLKIDSKMEVIADNTDGQAYEELEIEQSGPEVQINIDAGYLIDALRVLDGDVVMMELRGSLNPLVIKEKDFTYLVMPVRQ